MEFIQNTVGSISGCIAYSAAVRIMLTLQYVIVNIKCVVV